jgi:2-keto-4-pentenoate hydratase/2-oxohepta-3-ene-1,7-dioic acid hydratase in catechol pathway
MRIVQYTVNGDSQKTPHVGVRVGDKVVDLKMVNAGAPNSLIEILKQQPELLKNLDAAKLKGVAGLPLADVALLPPISGSDKVVCIGMNYKDHCEEQNVPVPVEPIFFSKWSSCLAGPQDSIPYPEVTKELDYEVELAVVIGKKGKNLNKSNVMDHILGYTVAHDVSARDWQLKKNGGQWLVGKAMDAFAPIGPEIVTKDEIPDPHKLAIKCRVNGVTKQDSNTNQIVHRVEKCVEMLSSFVTLLPGDIIFTGTPPGVGVFSKPPFFLKKGDVVECEIENIGVIRNAII